MNSEYEILEKIALYTKGEMGGVERIQFEKELEADPHLQRQMQLSMLVEEMVVAKEALKLKEQMRKDLYKQKPNLGLYLGASLLVLGAIGGALFYTGRQTAPEGVVSVPKVSPTVYNTIDSKTPNTPSATAPAVRPSSQVNPNKTEKNLIVTQSSPQQVAKEEEVLEEKVVPQPKRQEVPVLEKENNQPLKPEPVSPCASLQKEVEYSVTQSCKGEATGEVIIHAESVKGGKAPYTFTLGEHKASSHFSNLASGSYSLLITDAQNCSVESPNKIWVGEKTCKSLQQHVFNPEYDHAWIIPYDKDKKPTRISILDKNGRVFYESGVSGHQPAEWKAESSTGMTLAMGLYFFHIEYADGDMDEGSIMITK